MGATVIVGIVLAVLSLTRVSERWRREQTAEAIAAAFKPFVDAQIDLGVLEGLTAIFYGGPTSADNGWLTLSGYYPTAEEGSRSPRASCPRGSSGSPGLCR